MGRMGQRRRVTHALFAWWYYGMAMWLLMVVPHAVADKHGMRAAFYTHWLLVYLALCYYTALTEIIWQR